MCFSLKSRQEAEKTYERLLRLAMGQKKVVIRSALATLGRKDLYFLLTRFLHRQDLRHDWIFARCQEVSAAPDGYLDLWAREHCKSSLITFGLTIQNILQNPELSIVIFSHTRSMARNFLSQIKREFEGNELLKLCYPEVLWQNPKKESPCWSMENGLLLKRSGNQKEATLESWGLVDGQPTGKHFQLMVYDDVVTRESVSSAEQIAKTTEAWALSLNLGARGGRRRYIGTRYHLHDTYREIIERGAAIPRIYPATENGVADGVPVLLSPELLAEKRRQMGSYVFGCQMLQNPLAESAQGFMESWLRFWEPIAPESCLQSEYEEKTEGSANGNWGAFNRFILVDPAGERKKGSDYTVLLVMGLGADRNWYLIDGIRDRLNLKERADALFRLHQLYFPDLVGYEKYGMQADVEFIESEQERRNYRFPIITLGGSVPKNDRIRALAPYFEQGRIYLPRSCPFRDRQGRWRDLSAEFIQDEYLLFPLARHDDMLDCLARILEPTLGAVFPEPDMPSAVQDAEMDYDFFGL